MGESVKAKRRDDGLPLQPARALPHVIAVDGSAASGKSTIGQRLAQKLGCPFLDTGVMYRAITFAALSRGIDPHDHPALSGLAVSVRLDVAPPASGSSESCSMSVDGIDVTAELRRRDVEDAVSLVSRVVGVRDALVTLQREIAGRQPMVMAGRDIGTVVLPNADLKIYLDASPEERARRRYQEFAAVSPNVSEETVLADLRRRDQIDSERAVSPLRPADDAVIINTDGLTQEEVLRQVLALVERRS